MPQERQDPKLDDPAWFDAWKRSLAPAAAIWGGSMAASNALEILPSLKKLAEDSPSMELLAAFHRLFAQRMLSRYFGIPSQGTGAWGITLKGEERRAACAAALRVLDNVFGLDKYPAAYQQFAALDDQVNSDWAKRITTEEGDRAALIEAQAVLELSARILRGEIDPQLPWSKFPFSEFSDWVASASPSQSWDPYEVVALFRALGHSHREMYKFVQQAGS